MSDSLLPKLLGKRSTTAATPGGVRSPPAAVDDDLLSVLKKPKSGLVRLMETLKSTGSLENLLAVGVDLETLGWPLDQPEPLWTVMNGPNIFQPVLTKAVDAKAPPMPDCYTIPNIAPLGTKVSRLKDEALIYTFYAFPRQRAQELAAKELTLNNWRFLIKDKVWAINMTTSPQSSHEGSMHQWYTFSHVWDPQVWALVERPGKVATSEVDDRYVL
jgi:hypothetical protein